MGLLSLRKKSGWGDGWDTGTSICRIWGDKGAQICGLEPLGATVVSKQDKNRNIHKI
jgi:hypothetical protein